MEQRIAHLEKKIGVVEQKLTNVEQRLVGVDTGIVRLEKGFSELSSTLTEFMLFVKGQFERQEKMFEEVLAVQKEHTKRLDNIEGTLGGIQQAFLFKAF